MDLAETHHLRSPDRAQRGGFAGLLLRSVSQLLVAEAACPIVAVRADRRVREGQQPVPFVTMAPAAAADAAG